MKKILRLLKLIILIFFVSTNLSADEDKKPSSTAATEAKLKGGKDSKTREKPAKPPQTVEKAKPALQVPISPYPVPVARSTGGQTAEEAVDRLLGVNSAPSRISPRPSDYIYSRGGDLQDPSYGRLYGNPNYSQYQSPTSLLRRTDHLRYPSIYQHPNATSLFYPGRVGIRFR